MSLCACQPLYSYCTLIQQCILICSDGVVMYYNYKYTVIHHIIHIIYNNRLYNKEQGKMTLNY